MPEFTIQKNMPRPVRTSSLKGKTKYPFNEMDVGDYFAVGTFAGAVRAAREAWYRNNPASSFRFAISKTPDGYGCWRVA